MEWLEDLPGSPTLLVGVGPREVEVELVEEGFSQEVGAAGAGFQIEELVPGAPGRCTVSVSRC